MNGSPEAPVVERGRRHAVFLALFPALLLAPPFAGIARAQTSCIETARFDPPLRVLRCTDSLVLEAERAATLRLVDRDGGRDCGLSGANLGGRAVLVTLPAGGGHRRGGFQILTPHAIASVRGTVYAVDVEAARTAVFVARGRVAVARREAPRTAVTLGPGEGVDVEAGGSALTVRRWPASRVAALLERFGR